MRMEDSDSSASAPLSARASCDARDSRCRRLAMKIAETAMIGTTPIIMPASVAEMRNIITTAPSSRTTLRSAMLALIVTVVWITVVSLARRLISSPVRRPSKKAISCDRTCA